MSSPSHSPSDLVVDRVRPRAPTIELQAPVPGDSPTVYTADRIQAGLNFAQSRLKSTTRKVSPVTEGLLTIYTGACTDYLSQWHQTKTTDVTLINEIRNYEKDMQESRWIKSTPDLQTQELHDNLLELRRVQYYARYGDYAQRVAHLVRSKAQTLAIEGWERLSGTFQWSEIAKALKQESAVWKEFGSMYPSQTPTTIALYNACLALAITPDSAISAIRTYGERCNVVHSSFDQLLQSESFSQIAQIIHDDLRDLHSIIPGAPGWDQEESFMRATIIELKTSWFDTSFGDDTPGNWIASVTLQEKYNDWKKGQDIAAKITSQQRENVAKNAVEKLAKIHKDFELCQQLNEKPNPKKLPVAGPQPESRKRSLNNVLAKQTDRKEVWKKRKCQEEIGHKSYIKAISTQLEVNRITQDIRETWGSSPPPSSPPGSPSGPSSPKPK